MITLLLAVAVLGPGMLLLNGSLSSPEAPSGMWDLELARTPARAQAIVDSWTRPASFAASGTSPNQAVQAASALELLHAHLLLLCGFPFCLCYASAISMALAWLAELQAKRTLVVAAAWTSMLAGLADATENALLLALLQPPLRAALVVPIYAVSIAKFTLLLFSLFCLHTQLMASERKILSNVALMVLMAIAMWFADAFVRSLP